MVPVERDRVRRESRRSTQPMDAAQPAALRPKETKESAGGSAATFGQYLGKYGDGQSPLPDDTPESPAHGADKGPNGLVARLGARTKRPQARSATPTLAFVRVFIVRL